MITRFALFDDSIAPGKSMAIHHHSEIKVSLILANSYPDTDTMTSAFDTPAQQQSKEMTGANISEFFKGVFFIMSPIFMCLKTNKPAEVRV